MPTKIISVFTKKEDIGKIVANILKYDFDSLVRHKHFEFSIDEKLVDIEKIKETFSKYSLIKSIELRENERRQRHYSFNYGLEDGTFVIISLALDREPPLIINAFHVQRNYKNFEKSLRKNYGKRFVYRGFG